MPNKIEIIKEVICNKYKSEMFLS